MTWTIDEIRIIIFSCVVVVNGLLQQEGSHRGSHFKADDRVVIRDLQNEGGKEKVSKPREGTKDTQKILYHYHLDRCGNQKYRSRGKSALSSIMLPFEYDTI